MQAQLVPGQDWRYKPTDFESQILARLNPGIALDAGGGANRFAGPTIRHNLRDEGPYPFCCFGAYGFLRNNQRCSVSRQCGRRDGVVCSHPVPRGSKKISGADLCEASSAGFLGLLSADEDPPLVGI